MRPDNPQRRRRAQPRQSVRGRLRIRETMPDLGLVRVDRGRASLHGYGRLGQAVCIAGATPNG